LGSFLSEGGKREEEGKGKGGKGERGKKEKKEKKGSRKNIKGIGILMEHYTPLL